MEEKVYYRHGSVYSEVLAIRADPNSELDFYVVFADEARVASTRRLSLRADSYTQSAFAFFKRKDIPEGDHQVTRYIVETLASVPDVSLSKYGPVEQAVIDSVLENPYKANCPHISHAMPASWIGFVTRVFDPVLADGGHITLTRNAKEAALGRRTTMKPGRAFRHMLHWMTNAEVASITEVWIEHTSPRVFTLHVSDKAEDFALAYDHNTAPYRNPVTTSMNKSLATSCMQGITAIQNGDVVSVGECYASGDFQIAYLKDKKGLIAGRVVIGYKANRDGVKTAYHGPLYGCCEQSLEELHTYLASIDALADSGNWCSLRLKAIATDCGNYLGSYMDGGYEADVIGDYFVLVESGGTFSFAGTNGFADDAITCDHCGDYCDHDGFSGEEGEPLCDYCFNETYAFTDDGDMIRVEDAVSALAYNGSGVYHVTVHLDEAVYIEPLDQYWVAEDVTYVDHLEEHYPTHRLDELNEEEEEEAA
jgi:hypothetical protein|tara:strand:+ start:2389 stop:3825 length:1437 start_codon:yes stop_codon:yes gene_type:complete